MVLPLRVDPLSRYLLTDGIYKSHIRVVDALGELAFEMVLNRKGPIKYAQCIVDAINAGGIVE